MRAGPLPRQSWLGSRVFFFGTGSGFTLPILAGVCDMCIRVRGLISAPPHLAGVSGCFCLCARSTCTPPILAEGCGAFVRLPVLASPCQSWLSCWGAFVCLRAWPVPQEPWLRCAVRLFGSGFWLRPANPGSGSWCMCLSSGLALTLPILAGVLECVCSFACSASTRESWLEFVMCVFGYGFWLHPAIPDVDLCCVGFRSGFAFTPPILARVSGCLCLCARSVCTPPILAEVCDVLVEVRGLSTARQSWRGCWGVFVRPGALAVPCQTWLGSAVCLFCFGFRVHPTSPGCGLRCVCLGSSVGFSPPMVTGVAECVCSCARSACSSPILAGVCRVCSWARVLASACHSWLRVVVCLSGCWFCFHPANPGQSGWMCVLMWAPYLRHGIPGCGLRCVCSGAGSGFPRPLWLQIVVCVTWYKLCSHPACLPLGCGRKPVNRSQEAQDTAHTTQRTKRAHR